MSYYHLTSYLQPGCPAGQPCQYCWCITPAVVVNAAAETPVDVVMQDADLTTLSTVGNLISASIEENMTQFEMDMEDLLVTPTADHSYVHDDYTPSYNNPFFSDFHAYHPRGGQETVDYY